MAVLRAFAIEEGLYATEPEKAYQIDTIMETWGRVFDKWGAVLGASKEKKEEEINGFVQKMADFLHSIEHDMEENGWTWVAGDNLTCADFCIGAFMWNYALNEDSPVQLKIQSLFEDNPKVKEAAQQLQNEAFKYYLTSREKYPF